MAEMWRCPDVVHVFRLCVSLISYTEQYMEYDAFVTAPEPSNPWTSDEPSFWDLENRYQTRPQVHRQRQVPPSFQSVTLLLNMFETLKLVFYSTVTVIIMSFLIKYWHTPLWDFDSIDISH